VGLVLRLGPDRFEPAGWVSAGSGIVVVSWIVSSAAFLAYLTQLASYGSVFGALATVVVLFAYLYLSSVVFVFGVQADALLRADVLDEADAAHPERGAVPSGA
jgi:membrane protein